MYIKSIGIALPKEKVVLDKKFLSNKKHFENEKEVVFYRASTEETPLTLAYSASHDALNREGLGPKDIDAVIYAKSLLKDYESWSLSAAICNKLGINDKMFLDIYQGCNGMTAGLNLAYHLLNSNANFRNILVTTSQILPARFGKHELIDTGGIFSDGASAVVISRTDGRYRICSIMCDYKASLNDMIKLPMGGYRHVLNNNCYEQWNVTAHKDMFWGDKEPDIELFHKLKQQNVLRAIEKARVKQEDLSFIIMHNYCRLYNSTIIKLFKDFSEEKFSNKVGMKFSHMGASDIIMNLSVMEKEIKSGNLCLLHQDGAGFSFGTIIIERLV